MSNLLIIGNGFDVAHGLKTRYKYFREYLYSCTMEKEYAEDVVIENPEVPGVHIYTKEGSLYSLREDCKYLFSVIDNAAKKEKQPDLEWNMFEELLGKLNHCEVLEKNQCDELAFIGIRDSLGTLEKIFFEWIKTINIDGASGKKFLKQFINPDDDLFVNFNYTETIEKVYGVQSARICYIHGKREMDPNLRERYEMTSFGTGNRKLIVGHDRRKINPGKRFSKYKGTEMYEMLLVLQRELVKDTDEILYDNKEFFARIKGTEIQNILSFGFSFSDVDIPQIKAICDSLNGGEKKTKKMVWYLNDFDKKKNRRFKRIIRRCGYSGKFKLYESDNKEIYTKYF